MLTKELKNALSRRRNEKDFDKMISTLEEDEEEEYAGKKHIKEEIVSHDSRQKKFDTSIRDKLDEWKKQALTKVAKGTSPEKSKQIRWGVDYVRIDDLSSMAYQLGYTGNNRDRKFLVDYILKNKNAEFIHDKFYPKKARSVKTVKRQRGRGKRNNKKYLY